MGFKEFKTKEEFLNAMKKYLIENGWPKWGKNAKKLEAGQFKEDSTEHAGKPWYDWAPMRLIHHTCDTPTVGDYDPGSPGVRDFLFEPAPEHWWNHPKHPEAPLRGKNMKSYAARKKIGKPYTRYEYLSHKTIGTNNNEGFYMGMEVQTARKDELFNINKENVQWAGWSEDDPKFISRIMVYLKGLTDFNNNDGGKIPALDIMEYVLINLEKDNDVASKALGGWGNIKSVWHVQPPHSSSGSDRGLNFVGDSNVPNELGFVLFKLLTSDTKRVNAFNKATMGVLELSLLSTADGEFDMGFSAFDQGQFFKKVLKFLHDDEFTVWDDTKAPPIGVSAATPKVKKRLVNAGPDQFPATSLNWDGKPAPAQQTTTNRQQVGLVQDGWSYGHGSDKTEISEKGQNQAFYRWLMPNKFVSGQDADYSTRREDYVNMMISAFEGIRSGTLSKAKVAQDFGWIWDSNAQTGVEDLAKYKLGGYLNWSDPLVRKNAILGQQMYQAIPQSLKTDKKSYTMAKSFSPGSGKRTNNIKKDVSSFNSTATVVGTDWASLKGNDEASNKLVEKVKKLFENYSGMEEDNVGPRIEPPDKTSFSNYLGKDFFKKQFSGLQPSTTNMLQTKISLTTESDDATMSAATRDKIKQLLPDIQYVEFERGSDAFKAIYVDGTKTELRSIPFQEIIERFYMMAYIMYIIYQYERQKSGASITLLSSDFTDWYAEKAARFYRRIWQQITHDYTVGNLYALIVLIIAEGAADKIDDETLDALLDLVQGATDDMVADVGTTGMPDSVLNQEAGMSEASKEQRERFYKQCALMLNMHELAIGNTVDDSSFHEHSYNDGYTSYNGRIHLVKNNEGGAHFSQNTNIINKLISPQPKDVKKFTNITVAEASKLVPYVRLYKVYNHDSNGKGLEGNLEEVEFSFPLYPFATTSDYAQGYGYDKDASDADRLRDAREMALSNMRRGSGTGIKEFSWEYDGETPATASKYIKAKLHLFFQDFSEFIARHHNPDGEQFSFVDLFVSPTNISGKAGPGYNAPHHLRYEPDYYRIRADVGYNPLSGDGMNDALQMQNTSFFLVLVDHEISINDDLTVDIVANYRAYIEEAVDSQKFNALNSPEVKKLRDKHMQDWEDALKAKESGECSTEQLNKVRSSINGEMRNLVKKQHKSIMTNLLKQDKIHFIDFDTTEIDNFRQNGSFGAIPPYKYVSFAAGDQQSVKDHLKNLDFDADYQPWLEHYKPDLGLRVYYFYLGDLMYLLMSNLYKGEVPWESDGIIGDEAKSLAGAERTKMLLMDFDYENILSPSQIRHTINIADIPISVDYFFDWYVDNIIKNEVTQMPIGTFVRKILTELITEAMAEVCITGTEGHYVTFQLGSFVAGAVQLPGSTSYVDPIVAALATQPDPNPGQPDSYDPPEAEDPQSFPEDTPPETIEVDNGDGTFETQPNPAFEEWMAAADAMVDAAADPVTGEVNESATGNSYRFDVNEFYNTPHLPLPRVPDDAFLETRANAENGQYNYIMIYGDFADPYHSGRGNREEDEAAGTYHLDLGADRGLVKKISFSKNNIPYHRESRMFNQGQAGNLQLSAVYDCNITMIGNTLFLPGMEFFVDPFGFGGEDFGKPQDRPLEYRSPSAGDIRKYNSSHRDTMKPDSDGGTTQTSAELGNLSNQLDNINAGVRGPHKDSQGVTKPVSVFSYANLMGIGGYQLITGIQCSITPGKYETTIKAKHTYTGYPKIQQSQKLIEYRNQADSVSSADSSVANACEAILKRRELGLLK